MCLQKWKVNAAFKYLKLSHEDCEASLVLLPFSKFRLAHSGRRLEEIFGGIIVR